MWSPTLPSGLEAFTLPDAFLSEDKSRSLVVVCKDDDGACYLHIEQQPPKVEPRWLQASGLSEAEFRDAFFTHFAARMDHRVGHPPCHVDAQKGCWTYRIDGIDLKGVSSFDDHPMREAAREIQFRYAADTDYMPRYQATNAKADILNTLPPQDLVSTLRLAGEVIDSKGPKDPAQVPRCGDFADVLEQQPGVLKKITDELAKGGIDRFRYLGWGKTGVCLEAETARGKKVAVMLRMADKMAEVQRCPVPQHLQLLHAFHAGDIHVEVSPKLDSRSATAEDLGLVKNGVAHYVAEDRKRYKVSDDVFRNIGRSDTGTPYYLDGDGIVETAEPPSAGLPNPSLSRWVKPDGTWEQYREFEEEHRAFNSPLHQRMSALLADAPDVRGRVEEGRNRSGDSVQR